MFFIKKYCRRLEKSNLENDKVISVIWDLKGALSSSPYIPRRNKRLYYNRLFFRRYFQRRFQIWNHHQITEITANFKLSYLRAPKELGNKMPDLNVSGKYYSFLHFLSKNISGAQRNLILKTIKLFQWFRWFQIWNLLRNFLKELSKK